MILTSMLTTPRRNKVDVLCIPAFLVIAYPGCLSFAEYNDDSTIIPRSSSVIVKRMPAARLGKGKASYYASGVTSTAIPTSEPVQRPGSASNVTWHKGSMSKRFDGKEDSHLSSSNTPGTKSATSVRLLLSIDPGFWRANSNPYFRVTLRRKTNKQLWRPCSKPRQRIGRRPKKRCHSRCRSSGHFIYVVARILMSIFFFVHLSSYLLLCSIFTQSAENLFKPTRRDCDSTRRQAQLRSPAWSTASYKLCLLSLWKERFARTKFSRKDATNKFKMKVTGYRIVRRTMIENMITNHE